MTILSLTLNEEPGGLVSAIGGRCEDLGGASSYSGALRNTERVFAIREFRSTSTRPSSAQKSVNRLRFGDNTDCKRRNRTSDLVRDTGFQLCQLRIVQVGSREGIAVFEVVRRWGRLWPFFHASNSCVLPVVVPVHDWRLRRRYGLSQGVKWTSIL